MLILDCLDAVNFKLRTNQIAAMTTVTQSKEKMMQLLHTGKCEILQTKQTNKIATLKLSLRAEKRLIQQKSKLVRVHLQEAVLIGMRKNNKMDKQKKTKKYTKNNSVNCSDNRNERLKDETIKLALVSRIIKDIGLKVDHRCQRRPIESKITKKEEKQL